MRYRALGATGLLVSEIGIGCSRIGGVLAPGASRKDELALLGAAADAGINLYDTSDLYSQGESEILVGKAFRHRRSDVLIATKGGYVVPSGRRMLARVKPIIRPVVQRLGIRPPRGPAQGGVALAQDFSPAHICTAVEGSLRRLGTDHIDLYQLHSPPRSVVESAELAGALEQLHAQGKIRHFGIAADTAGDVMGFDQHPGVASLQVPFSLLEQHEAHALLQRAAEHGVGVISRSCYAGRLAQRRPVRAGAARETPDWEQILRLRQAALTLGRPLLEAALQFNLAVEHAAATLLGMRTPEHLRDNLRLYSTAPLDPDELAVLASIHG